MYKRVRQWEQMLRLVQMYRKDSIMQAHLLVAQASIPCASSYPVTCLLPSRLDAGKGDFEDMTQHNDFMLYTCHS